MKLGLKQQFIFGATTVFIILVSLPILVFLYFSYGLHENYTIWPPIIFSVIALIYVGKQGVRLFNKFLNTDTNLRLSLIELQARFEDYRHLINGMNEMIFVLNMDGGLIDVNDSVKNALKYDLPELRQIGIDRFTDNLTEAGLKAFLSDLPENELRIIESIFVGKDGYEIPVELFINVVIFKGRQSGLIIARDITTRKELQKKQKQQEALQKELYDSLLVAKEKAEESDRLKMSFLANMSHEIRTPMNGILGFMELLKDSSLEEECRQEYIQLVNISGQRLLNTINDIIEISKIESGERDLKLEKINLEDVMNYMNTFFRQEADSRNLQFRMNQKVIGDAAVIVTDKFKLDGILTNLIKNAIKFTKEGSVEFGNYVEDGMLHFFVKDTGRGIAPDKLNTIFERFVQAEEHLARNYEGSGLGLAIAKAYVETLGGFISVESEPYKGSTFKFCIPYTITINGYSKIKNKNESVVIEKARCIDRSCTIVIAEDDDISFRYLEKLLHPKNVNLIRATTGLEAVKILRENPQTRLVFMDIKMPDLDGLEATRLIRKFNRSVPIIAQTAYALPGDKEMSQDAGCTDYISKPINRQELNILFEKYITTPELVSQPID